MSIYNLIREHLADSTLARPRYTAYSAAETETPKRTQSRSDRRSALSALARYIPAETITIYIAGLSVEPIVSPDLPFFDSALVYWICLALTPLLVVLVFYSEKRSLVLSAPISWPYWPLFSATIAFAIWGLAVPGAPFINAEGVKALTGFAALLVSVVLDAFSRIVGNGASEIEH